MTNRGWRTARRAASSCICILGSPSSFILHNSSFLLASRRGATKRRAGSPHEYVATRLLCREDVSLCATRRGVRAETEAHESAGNLSSFSAKPSSTPESCHPLRRNRHALRQSCHFLPQNRHAFPQSGHPFRQNRHGFRQTCHPFPQSCQFFRGPVTLFGKAVTVFRKAATGCGKSVILCGNAVLLFAKTFLLSGKYCAFSHASGRICRKNSRIFRAFRTVRGTNNRF